jgi:hypothetical protein
MEINYGTRAEASMPATSSRPDPGHIKTLVFDKAVIDGMMLITGRFLVWSQRGAQKQVSQITSFTSFTVARCDL